MKLFKRKIELYPITISDMTDHYDEIWELFTKKKLHKDGVFVDLFLLETLWDDGDAPIFNFGDKLIVAKGDTEYGQLAILDSNGRRVGKMPHESSALPNLMLDLKIKMWCYVEAVDTSEFFPAVALSLYCEKY